MTVTVTYPDGRDQDLIKIGDWDFNWQHTYEFEKPIDLPKGSVVQASSPTTTTPSTTRGTPGNPLSP